MNKMISSFWLKNIKRKFLPNHLLGRFVAIIVFPLVLLEIALGGFFYTRHWDTLSHRLARDISGEIETIAEWVQESTQAPFGQPGGRVNEDTRPARGHTRPRERAEAAVHKRQAAEGRSGKPHADVVGALKRLHCAKHKAQW